MLSVRRISVPRPSRPPLAGLVVAAAALGLATLLAAFLERQLDVRNATVVYLLPVVAVSMVYGSWLAIATSLASFLLYDFFFVQPLYTFSVAAPEEWLDLLLFLVVAIVIGRLGALQLQRRREADLRTAEARALFSMSRDIATAATALEAAPSLATRLAREAEMARIWIALGPSIADERPVSDSRPGEPRPSVAARWVLHPGMADAQPGWVRVHEPAPGGRRRDRDEALVVFRVPVAAGGETIGSIWGTRRRDDPFPGRSHTRLMAAAADQFGQSVVRDRLASEATAAEVARESDALKTALLDSVSHDLRTPLAAIRAAAGNLMDPDVDWTREEERLAAHSIDAEAQRLSRLVRNMLDLSRIEGGALHPSVELYDLADVVDPVVERVRPIVEPGTIELAMPEGLPPVRVDALFVDQILTNMLENAARYAAGAPIRVSARPIDERTVELVVEDGGPGVPDSALPHLFERFYRVPPRRGIRGEGGSGVGLAVVRGMAEAMGGSVVARASELGGLAVAVRLPAARVETDGEIAGEPKAGRPEGAPEARAAGASAPVEPAREPRR